MIHGLDLLGVRVTLASSAHTSESPWDGVAQSTWASAGVSRLEIHTPNIWDRRAIDYAHKYYDTFRRPPRLDSINYAPPSLIRWFGRLARDLDYDIIINNYAFWGRLVSPAMHRSSITVMDTLDLVSLYRPRFLLMERYLSEPPISPAGVDAAFLREDFFDAQDFRASDEEFRILDPYQYTLAITPADADLIARHTRHTRVVTLPMTQRVLTTANRYDGAAIFTSGRNPFNVQGYLYFVARVLPLVLAQESAFCLHVTGAVCHDVLPAERVELHGYVPSLDDEYAHAPFLICPILGKTGQQVKIVEAMAHSVPVIATRAAAKGSPIVHGVNGLIAGDAVEFAAHVIRLWRDRDLCRRMGKAAQETIAQEFSQDRMLESLKLILRRAS